ncbi:MULTISPECIES: SDR family NAD(P)-dependent oxidoreductase [Variovorax]|jgi:3-oxoacyl-[acyl-carrier protein] reductase|uniref:SDR family NAD(P)-dependent oxidoreductase n=1 Tax=Variovorax TaxID=34072 RepID=UPI00086A9AB2|nr:MULTISPECIES: SDR family oxidoreductase [Variovorax]MBN8757810.1 SDR family oxidoreductase [Variovorax sp.]ODU18060.1 MAG: 3-oxoacyl-ACP reductase [Variovorax sp. SCN 67-85]ODV24595.1 MAG: 3-oxoacyl-ACP reductase [Variovorax sp. SCN 67-20]OJZ13466.1 MAG: 3-oxoacyl-ACP reductase [Variovorax sp. 67-131]UKI06110.1 SDR family oxidoreductase [Variovorax paradoxus]
MSNEAATAPHAVVTGSSGGIGRAIASQLLEAGWRVSGIDLAAPTLSSHAGFTHTAVDLCNADAIARAAATLQDADALVHAAGVLRVGPLGALDHAGGELMWRLHVDAAARLADALVPAMAARGQGRVVFVGSRVAQGLPGRGQYAATKAALIALARSWAAEVAPQGVTVNVVSPGATQTSMLQDPARAGSAPRMPPIGRLIRPEEIAALVGFLLSPQAAAITGQDLAICGGSSLHR